MVLVIAYTLKLGDTMDRDEMFYSVNKGVPNYLTVSINVDTIIDYCASDKELLIKEMKQVRNVFTEEIFRTMNFAKSQHGFWGELCTRCKYKNSRNEVYVNPEFFLRKLKKILGVEDPSLSFNDLSLRQKMRERIEVLKGIKTPEELKEQFPLIYEDFLLAKRGYTDICISTADYSATKDPEVKELVNRKWKVYNRYGLDSRFKQFMEKQCLAYRNYVERRTFVESYCFTHAIPFEQFKGLDKAKFELYLADKYLSLAFSATSIEEKQKCLYYVTSYIRETKFTDVTIKNDAGEVVTFRKLLNRYKKILKTYQALKPIDESRDNFTDYNIRHTENHVKKYFGSEVNWTIVPNGCDVPDEVKERIVQVMNRHYSHLTLAERTKKIKEKYDTYDRKVAFFEKTKYVLKIYGISKFDGYIAFVYPNGEILLERFFSDYAECMPATGEAVYNLNIYNFEELSKYSKLELIRSKSAKRILHGASFEKVAQAVVDKPVTPEVKEDVEQFVLKFKPKKNDQ